MSRAIIVGGSRGIGLAIANKFVVNFFIHFWAIFSDDS